MTPIAITPDRLPALASQMIPHLESTEDDFFAPEEILEEVAAGKRQAWGVLDGETLIFTIITGLMHDRYGRLQFTVTHMAGDLTAVEHFTPIIIEWAKAQGAEIFKFEGRYGFLRRVKKWGFKPVAITLEMRL